MKTNTKTSFHADPYDTPQLGGYILKLKCLQCNPGTERRIIRNLRVQCESIERKDSDFLLESAFYYCLGGTDILFPMLCRRHHSSEIASWRSTGIRGSVTYNCVPWVAAGKTLRTLSAKHVFAPFTEDFVGVSLLKFNNSWSDAGLWQEQSLLDDLGLLQPAKGIRRSLFAGLGWGESVFIVGGPDMDLIINELSRWAFPEYIYRSPIPRLRKSLSFFGVNSLAIDHQAAHKVKKQHVRSSRNRLPEPSRVYVTFRTFPQSTQDIHRRFIRSPLGKHIPETDTERNAKSSFLFGRDDLLIGPLYVAHGNGDLDWLTLVRQLLGFRKRNAHALIGSGVHVQGLLGQDPPPDQHTIAASIRIPESLDHNLSAHARLRDLLSKTLPHQHVTRFERLFYEVLTLVNRKETAEYFVDLQRFLVELINSCKVMRREMRKQPRTEYDPNWLGFQNNFWYALTELAEAIHQRMQGFPEDIVDPRPSPLFHKGGCQRAILAAESVLLSLSELFKVDWPGFVRCVSQEMYAISWSTVSIPPTSLFAVSSWLVLYHEFAHWLARQKVFKVPGTPEIFALDDHRDTPLKRSIRLSASRYTLRDDRQEQRWIMELWAELFSFRLGSLGDWDIYHRCSLRYVAERGLLQFPEQDLIVELVCMWFHVKLVADRVNPRELSARRLREEIHPLMRLSVNEKENYIVAQIETISGKGSPRRKADRESDTSAFLTGKLADLLENKNTRHKIIDKLLFEFDRNVFILGELAYQLEGVIANRCGGRWEQRCRIAQLANDEPDSLYGRRLRALLAGHPVSTIHYPDLTVALLNKNLEQLGNEEAKSAAEFATMLSLWNQHIHRYWGKLRRFRKFERVLEE